MVESTSEHVNGIPVNVLSEKGKLALDDLARGVEARKIAMQLLARDTEELRRNGWQTVAPLAFHLVKAAREMGVTVPLDTMLKLRKRWQTATDEELHPIMRDVNAGLLDWIPVNLKAVLDAGLAAPES